jgi:SagB-type dehydrogenase family enzyme
LTREQAGQLLWAAQGITADWGGRTAPSAGRTYPLECYLVAGKVDSLAPGVYHYAPGDHSLAALAAGDKRNVLCSAASSQQSVRMAPASIVIAADFARTTGRYGKRGVNYVYIEVGHCAQNIHLECEALGLGTVCIGAFDDDAVKKVLDLSEQPIYIMPVGYEGK